jgi:DNA-directed RNA polymerase subunit RPC12/RpoP
LVVVCNQCGTEYTFAPSSALSANQSFQFRCTNCGHRFSVNQERIEEAPEEVEAPTPTAMLLRQGSDVYRVNGMATLQRWIVQLRVDQDDRLSTGDDRWERLGDIADLAQFFEVIERARASQEESPTESLSGLPPKPTIPFLPDPRSGEREDPTEDATVDTTWEAPLLDDDLIPDPSLPELAPIRPPASLEPDVSDDPFLNEEMFFSEPQAASRPEPADAVHASGDDVEWRSGGVSNTWIGIGVVVAALLLLMWVEPWASDEALIPAAADLSTIQEPAKPAGAEPAGDEPFSR